jgi:rod shape-determining protein MreB
MALFGKEFGIDLGTDNVLIFEGNDIVLHEPAIVALQISEDKVVAVGQEAREMYGRTPEEIIEVIKPIHHGVIADYEVTAALLNACIRKVNGGGLRLFRPKVMVSVPWGVTSVESRAVYAAVTQAGVSSAALIQGPLAAAIGAGLPIGTPSGNMILTCGAGVTEAAIIAMNGIVSAKSARVGGGDLDQAIVSYVRRKYGLTIGELTAEQIKLRIGAALPLDETLSLEINGRDQVTGLPRSIKLTNDEVTDALQETLAQIISVARAVLETTPPELAADAIDRGMVITGGTAQLRGIDRLLTRETGVPAYLADNPMACVAIGCGRALQMYETLRPMLPKVG